MGVYKLQQLKSIDGPIHSEADKTVFPEMSVIFEVLLYPELQVNPDHKYVEFFAGLRGPLPYVIL